MSQLSLLGATIMCSYEGSSSAKFRMFEKVRGEICVFWHYATCSRENTQLIELNGPTTVIYVSNNKSFLSLRGLFECFHRGQPNTMTTI